MVENKAHHAPNSLYFNNERTVLNDKRHFLHDLVKTERNKADNS